MQLKCECTGTVFHVYSEEGGITARCANPECGLWAFGGGAEDPQSADGWTPDTSQGFPPGIAYEIGRALAAAERGHDPATCRNGDHYGQCSGATPLPAARTATLPNRKD